MKKFLAIIFLIMALFYIDNVNATSYTHRIKVLNNQTNLRKDPGGWYKNRFTL